MTTQVAAERPNDLLLGEIETEIVAIKRRLSALCPGDKVFLSPDSAAGRTGRTLHVENGDAEIVGQIPRRLGAWLFPLVKANRIRVEGYLPMTPESSPPALARRGVVLTVYQTDAADILAAREPTTEAEAIHEMVRQTYCAAQRYPKPEMVLAVSRGLGGLGRVGLLPETHLLLAMLPGLAREVHACNGMATLVELQGLLGSLSLGTPVDLAHLRFYPLHWPQVRELPYLMLAAAVANGEAVIEETGLSTSLDGHTFVVNRGTRPVLIPEGEVICGEECAGVIATTTLLAAGASQAVPLCSIEEWKSGRAWTCAGRAMLAGPTVLLVNDGRDVARPAAVGTADPSLRTRRPVAPAPAPGDRPHVHYRVDAGRTNCLDANMPCEDERCYDGAFPFCEKSAGVVVASGGRIVGIDLFAGPDTLRSVWGPLAGSYFRRAVPDAAPTGVASPADVRAFIDRVAGAARPIKKFGTIGCELEILGDDLAGHALLFAGQVCHISAFVRPGEA